MQAAMAVSFKYFDAMAASSQLFSSKKIYKPWLSLVNFFLQRHTHTYIST